VRNVALFLLALAACGSGCASLARDHALAREQMLLEAGFAKKPAESDAQRAQLEKLPAQKLVPVPSDGGTGYVYADPDYCGCLYVGTQQAGDRFLAELTREWIVTDYADTATPKPVLTPREQARYEALVRGELLAPADPSLRLDAFE